MERECLKLLERDKTDFVMGTGGTINALVTVQHIASGTGHFITQPVAWLVLSVLEWESLAQDVLVKVVSLSVMGSCHCGRTGWLERNVLFAGLGFG